MQSFSSKKFSLIHIIAISLVLSGITYGLTSLWDGKQGNEISETTSNSCNYNVKRLNGYHFIKPIVFVDGDCESDHLAGLKQRVSEVIERYRAAGDADMASVYLRSSGEWMAVNETEKYKPGSLFKVPVLMTILKMDEDHPGFLNKKLLYGQAIDLQKTINYKSKAIELGKSYKVRELLEYMIRYSDNNATVLLEKNMDGATLQKLFADIGLEMPQPDAPDYFFTAGDYSLFMRTIYNAGYLNIKNSEYAAELLSQSEFKDGIAKGVPANVKLAHKFGEVGDANGKQLHESAIVYLNNKSYLVTVMTKGKDFAKLSQLIGEISGIVYGEMANEANAM